MLVCHVESAAGAGLAMQRGFLPQFSNYAAATQCSAVFETEETPATIRPLRGLRYVAYQSTLSSTHPRNDAATILVRSSIRSNGTAAKSRRLSQAKKRYVTAEKKPCAAMIRA